MSPFLDSRHLRLIAEVARTESVTRAADRAASTPRVGRRPVLDLPSLSFKSVNDADLPDEEASPLDVPAFLRRHEG